MFIQLQDRRISFEYNDTVTEPGSSEVLFADTRHHPMPWRTGSPGYIIKEKLSYKNGREMERNETINNIAVLAYFSLVQTN